MAGSCSRQGPLAVLEICAVLQQVLQGCPAGSMGGKSVGHSCSSS